MRAELSFRSWWVHECVDMVKSHGEQWLVGKGPWNEVPVFGTDAAWIKNETELRSGTETIPTRRSVRTEYEAREVPIRESRVYHAFASVKTPEQALEFARKYGLLGLNVAKPLTTLYFKDQLAKIHRLYSKVDSERAQQLAGAAQEKLSIIDQLVDVFDVSSLLHEVVPSPGEGDWLTLDEAQEALMLTQSEFEVFLSHMSGHRHAPILYPEKVSEWLRIAHDLRLMLDPPIDSNGYILEWGGVRRMTWARGEIVFHAPDPLSPVVWYESLRNAIFLEAALDSAGMKILPRECAEEGCSRWFSPRNATTLYCSNECKRRAQNRRQYERRKKRKGLSINPVNQLATNDTAGKGGQE